MHHPKLSATSTTTQRSTTLLEQPRRFSLQPQLPRCIDRYDCYVGLSVSLLSDSSPVSSSASLSLWLRRGMSSIWLLRSIVYTRIWSCLVLYFKLVIVLLHIYPRGSSNRKSTTISPISSLSLQRTCSTHARDAARPAKQQAWREKIAQTTYFWC